MVHLNINRGLLRALSLGLPLALVLACSSGGPSGDTADDGITGSGGSGGTTDGEGGTGGSGAITGGAGPGAGGGAGDGAGGGLVTVDDTDGWGNVRFDGGGFVSGILASPDEEGLFYLRTDVGGVYRLDEAGEAWLPLLDWLPQGDVGFLGVESFALDPSNPERLYLLVGTSYLSDGKSAVMISEDYGATFETVDISEQWRVHGNGMGRQSGEKLAVDPNHPDVLFAGTRAAGLFKSMDAGRTWENVSDISAEDGADLVNANGVSFVLFDADSEPVDEVTGTIYLGVSDATNPLYVSEDGGQTFDPIEGAPEGLMPNRAALREGKLFLTFASSPGPHSVTSGAFYSYDTTAQTWENLTPLTDDGMDYMGNGGPDAAHGFGGFSIDPTDPDHMLLSTLNYYGGQTRYESGAEGWGDRIYRTTDGGATWTTRFSYADATVPANANASTQGTQWINGKAIHWAGDLAFNPFDPSEAWVVSGNGVFRTQNLDAAAPVWDFTSRGIEETVPLDIVSVPGGPLVTAIGDYDGAVYGAISESYPIHNPAIGTTYSLGYAPLTGAFARAGQVTDYSVSPAVTENVMYLSTDWAATWTELPTPPGTHGLVVLSADGEVILHRPESSSVVHRSADMGVTWTPVTGLDGQAQYARIVCDPVNADVFYVLDQLGALKKSVDKGVSFAAVGSVQDDGASLFQASNGLIRTVPGREGHIWAPLDQAQTFAENGSFSTNGLAFSEDGGVTWVRFPAVFSAQAVGIGKAAEGADYETLFIWGVAGESSNSVGIYYSVDQGASFTRMNDDDHQYGGPGNGMFVQGDMNVFGRVYMSTSGRGLIYGHVGSLP